MDYCERLLKFNAPAKLDKPLKILKDTLHLTYLFFCIVLFWLLFLFLCTTLFIVH